MYMCILVCVYVCVHVCVYVCREVEKGRGGEWLLLLIPVMEQMASGPP